MMLRAQWPLGTIAQFFHFVAEEKKKKDDKKTKAFYDWTTTGIPVIKFTSITCYKFNCVSFETFNIYILLFYRLWLTRLITWSVVLTFDHVFSRRSYYIARVLIRLRISCESHMLSLYNEFTSSLFKSKLSRYCRYHWVICYQARS